MIASQSQIQNHEISQEVTYKNIQIILNVSNDFDKTFGGEGFSKESNSQISQNCKKKKKNQKTSVLWKEKMSREDDIRQIKRSGKGQNQKERTLEFNVKKMKQPLVNEIKTII